jgi:enamine deaminase RidA (YjgF/YER057c/UK114 family)
MSLELINPNNLPIPEMYTQVVVATGSKLVFLSGQQPEDIHGKLVGQHVPIIEEAQISLFGDHKPANVVVGVAIMSPGYLVEVDAIAVID